jgi:hypothetical protein
VSFIVCVALCAVFCLRLVCYFVWYVTVVTLWSHAAYAPPEMGWYSADQPRIGDSIIRSSGRNIRDPIRDLVDIPSLISSSENCIIMNLRIQLIWSSVMLYILCMFDMWMFTVLTVRYAHSTWTSQQCILVWIMFSVGSVFAFSWDCFCYLLRYNAVFRWKPNELACHLLSRRYLLCLFNLEDRDDMFLRNVGWLSADYMALFPRR